MTPPADAPETAGIHHVTAVAGDPGENVRFYREELGLRLVKRTVNFDDPTTYHLYYGDEVGTPGTILTFFPFENGRSGTPGRGQTTATAFVVPEDSLEFWTERFDDRGVAHDEPTERFGARVLPFEDGDGQPLELVESAERSSAEHASGEGRSPSNRSSGRSPREDGDEPRASDNDIEPWSDGPVPEEYAIRGFHGVTLHPTDPGATGTVLETLGYERTGEENDRVRYVAGERASVVDVLTSDGARGQPGVGTVHHVAFRAADDDAQAALGAAVSDIGMSTTPQKDRQYFRSIYFREPGGVLFEVATDEPGFATDEDVSELGSALKLPPWLEGDRERLEDALPPLELEGSA